VPKTVEAMMISAFDRIHGISIASSGTVRLERTPVPPPKTTKRAKAARVSGVAASGVGEVSGFTAVPSAAGEVFICGTSTHS
jgi:hypothetical protein